MKKYIIGKFSLEEYSIDEEVEGKSQKTGSYDEQNKDGLANMAKWGCRVFFISASKLHYGVSHNPKTCFIG